MTQEQVNIVMLVLWILACIVCILKGKWGFVIISVLGAVAEAVGPLIFGNYILNVVGEPLGLLPYIGAIRLAHPKSYWAFWFYRHNPQKYGRSLVRFHMLEEFEALH
jgi:hypothetical protein